MKLVAAAAAAALLFAVPAFAEDNAEVMAPIHAFLDGMDSGNIPMAAAAFTTSPTILDEVPPFHFSGATAFMDWGQAYGKDSAANGDTEGKLTLTGVQRVRVSGDNAYVVATGDYSFKRKGTPMVEHASITFALDKTASGWKIASWAFGG